MAKKQTKTKQKTPLMTQYYDVKGKYPDTVLLFRVGDFYETFGDDAILISKELGITLTKRNNGGDATPLAGFPYHAVDNYLPKLVKRGYKVAICEQTEDPAEAKRQGRKIVNREVTEITTPGVTFSDKLLDHKRNNYVLALHISGENVGVAFSDITTGEFALCHIAYADCKAFVQAIAPSEILIARKERKHIDAFQINAPITPFDDWMLDGDFCYKLLLDHFKTHSLKGFGVEDLLLAHTAAGALLHYVQETQKSALGHIRKLYAFESQQYMSLDPSTKRNLELIASIQQGNAEGTLISILDHSQTAMGGRMLRKWVMQPLKQLEPISNRLNAVEALFINHDLRKRLHEELGQISDLERLISKVCVGRCNARDLVQLQLSLQQIPQLKLLLQDSEEQLLQQIQANLKPHYELQERIAATLMEEPAAGLKEGNMIREGFNAELDELRKMARNGKEVIASLRDKLMNESGISSLKIGYNQVFGYYIEVRNTHKDKVPEHFIRKQTLVNAERYITPELKEVEEKILSAEERSRAMEFDLFQELRLYVADFAESIQNLAAALAQLDVLHSFAHIAYSYKYCKPKISEDGILDIKKGRHPVVERSLPMGEPFIPNDVYLDNESQQLMIITGPNMAGKSIILRQTGLIVLLAQIGSFVPAESAHIGIVDKIFTRVGASDNLAAGESTFLVEMNEAANILNNATPNSLILLDEVGRGTSTFDGLSIAWSLAEYLHNQASVAAKTLFATHYHELNELEQMYERVVNYNVQVKEHNGKVVFLRKLVKGGSDHSYGIQVANMAGLPSIVIERAKEILNNLESHSLDITNSSGTLTEGAKASKNAAASKKAITDLEPQAPIPQLSLFQQSIDPKMEMVIEKLKAVDPNRISPIEALIMLTEIRKELE